MTDTVPPATSVLDRSRVVAPIVLDAAAVLLFVIVGRDEHQQTSTLGDILTVAAPFLIGVAVGSALALLLGRPLRSMAAGAMVLTATIVVGMLLRRFVWDRGTALVFVLVTTGFVALCLLGWRAVGAWLRRRGYSRPIRAPRT